MENCLFLGIAWYVSLPDNTYLDKQSSPAARASPLNPFESQRLPLYTAWHALDTCPEEAGLEENASWPQMVVRHDSNLTSFVNAGVHKDSESDSESDTGVSEESGDREATVTGRDDDSAQAAGSHPGGSTQAEKLYTEIGQFNPALARAEKKRRKKEKKLRLGDDFDFAEAFADEVVIDGEKDPSDQE